MICYDDAYLPFDHHMYYPAQIRKRYFFQEGYSILNRIRNYQSLQPKPLCGVYIYIDNIHDYLRLFNIRNNIVNRSK